MIFNLADIPFEVLKQELTNELRKMTDIIPTEGVIKIVDACGGQVLYIPSKPSRNSYLISIIGKERFAALCEHYQGCDVFVPKLDKIRRRYRDMEIAAKNSGGQTVRELSSHYGLSSRSIRKVLSRTGDVACK